MFYMKKIIALMLVLVFAFAFVGCNKEPAHDHNHDHNHTTEIASNTEPVTKPVEKAPAFSYAEDQKVYKKGDAGVKTEGFKNTEKATVSTIKEAITLAQKEKTIESDSVDVRYDANAKVTMVSFYTEGMDGGDQSVYLDKDGKTILIVYGE
jgi:PBP1b-binding outer membrane lipoprotein LpoB